MKFARLLATGKSLVNGNVAGRYQMRKGLALPQFISPKNPFKQEAAARLVAPSPVAAAPASVIEPPLSAREANPLVTSAPTSMPVNPVGFVAKLPAFDVQKTFALLKLVVAKLRVAAKWSGEALKRAAIFCLDHNPFSAIGRPKLPGIPRFGKPEVQAELSLERVRVVRNDLAHADLEVVQAGGGTK